MHLFKENCNPEYRIKTVDLSACLRTSRIGQASRTSRPPFFFFVRLALLVRFFALVHFVHFVHLFYPTFSFFRPLVHLICSVLAGICPQRPPWKAPSEASRCKGKWLSHSPPGVSFPLLIRGTHHFQREKIQCYSQLLCRDFRLHQQHLL